MYCSHYGVKHDEHDDDDDDDCSGWELFRPYRVKTHARVRATIS